jgi:hypothetical protein
MKIKELVELLSKYDPELVVLIDTYECEDYLVITGYATHIKDEFIMLDARDRRYES